MTNESPLNLDPEKAKIALDVSVGVIAVYWIVFGVRQLTRAEHPLPPDVPHLMLRVLLTSVVRVGIVWILLRVSGQRLADLGFSLPKVARAIGYGLLCALGMFVVVNVALPTLMHPFFANDHGAVIQGLFRDPRDIPYWLVASIVGGGFAEELERAFALTRFEMAFGKAGLVLALVVGTFVFGLGHLYQGTSGAITAGAAGLLNAFVFLRRRSVSEAMCTHAWFDILGVAAAYGLHSRAG